MPSCESSSLKFRVTRKCIELVRPAKPTPHECKFLSDIDDQQFLRFHAPIIQFYRHVPSMEGRDLAKIIRESLAKALVFYYPVAGRLRELPGRKLMVECTSEGVLFIDADADVKLQDFGEDDIIHSPIPCLDELIYDVPGSSGIVNCPSLLIQISRTPVWLWNMPQIQFLLLSPPRLVSMATIPESSLFSIASPHSSSKQSPSFSSISEFWSAMSLRHFVSSLDEFENGTNRKSHKRQKISKYPLDYSQLKCDNR